CFKDTSCRRVHEPEIPFCGATKTERAELLVDTDRRGPENFGQLPATHPAQQIHLPEPILRHDVALRLGHVFDGGGADVGDAPAIAFDDHVFLQARKINVAVELRKRTVNVTPKGGAHDYDNDAKEDEQNAKQRSQAGSCWDGEIPSLE